MAESVGGSNRGIDANITDRSRAAGPPCSACEASARRLCETTIDIAAALFRVSASELRRSGRTTREIARIRQIAMYSAHTILGLSQREVGEAFGRDRTTVLHACHTIEDLREEKTFDQTVTLFETILVAAFQLQTEEQE